MNTGPLDSFGDMHIRTLLHFNLFVFIPDQVQASHLIIVVSISLFTVVSRCPSQSGLGKVMKRFMARQCILLCLLGEGSVCVCVSERAYYTVYAEPLCSGSTRLVCATKTRKESGLQTRRRHCELHIYPSHEARCGQEGAIC